MGATVRALKVTASLSNWIDGTQIGKYGRHYKKKYFNYAYLFHDDCHIDCHT